MRLQNLRYKALYTFDSQIIITPSSFVNLACLIKQGTRNGDCALKITHHHLAWSFLPIAAPIQRLIRHPTAISRILQPKERLAIDIHNKTKAKRYLH